MITPAKSLVGSEPRISVVIPTLNEADNLPFVLPQLPPWLHEVILVDGHSTDRTVEVARALVPHIRIVMQEGEGKGDALRHAFAAATGDIIVTLDADGSMDPGEIPAFADALLAGADFAKGSRFMRGGGTTDATPVRRLGNIVFVRLVRLLFGAKFTDVCYGYNAFWTALLPQLDLYGDRFEIETVMNIHALRAGLKIAEVPSFEYPRVYGTSRLRTIPDGLRVLHTMGREAWARRTRRKGAHDGTPANVTPMHSGEFGSASVRPAQLRRIS